MTQSSYRYIRSVAFLLESVSWMLLLVLLLPIVDVVVVVCIRDAYIDADLLERCMVDRRIVVCVARLASAYRWIV